MENNSIQPDEMERLLRETFLESDFPETDALADLMARQAFSTSWATVPPASKELEIGAKKGSWAGFSLNVWVAGLCLSIALGGGIYLYNSRPSESPVAARSPVGRFQKTVFPSLTKPDPVAPLQVKTNVPVSTAPRHKTNRLSQPEPAENHTGKLPADTLPSAPKPKSTDAPASGKRIPKRYVLIPDISPAEAALNEKRKSEMVQQTIAQDKKEWAFIPSGTTAVNGQAVSLQAFYMQTREVSNIQYKTFLYDLVLNDRLLEYEKAAVNNNGWTSMGMEPLDEHYFWRPVYDQYPVVNITPEAAKMYCDWLSMQVNKGLAAKGKPAMNNLRLPMEAEWIYAARADDETAVYAWKGMYLRNARGNKMANYRDGRGSHDEDMLITVPVHSYAPNGWGLYNMCGNVAEMTDPVHRDSLNLKGGAWNLPAEYLNLLHPNRIPVSKASKPTIGFRPVYTYTEQ